MFRVTPLPGIGDDEISLVVQHIIDGLSFVLSSSDDDTAASGLPHWMHASTFSALAFVLASKRVLALPSLYHLGSALLPGDVTLSPATPTIMVKPGPAAAGLTLSPISSPPFHLMPFLSTQSRA